MLGSYARSPWAAGRRSGWKSTVSPVSWLSLEEILPVSQGRELHQSPRETVWIMVCTTKLMPHRSRLQMRWFIEVSIRVPKTCFSIQTYVWPIYTSLPAAALAKHVFSTRTSLGREATSTLHWCLHRRGVPLLFRRSTVVVAFILSTVSDWVERQTRVLT